MRSKTRLGGVFTVTCRDNDGRVKWVARAPNLVVTEGLQSLLDVYLLSGTQLTSWYVGLTDGTPTVASDDTLSSHTGWAEVTAYSETDRQAFSGCGPRRR